MGSPDFHSKGSFLATHYCDYCRFVAENIQQSLMLFFNHGQEFRCRCSGGAVEYIEGPSILDVIDLKPKTTKYPLD